MKVEELRPYFSVSKHLSLLDFPFSSVPHPLVGNIVQRKCKLYNTLVFMTQGCGLLKVILQQMRPSWVTLWELGASWPKVLRKIHFPWTFWVKSLTSFCLSLCVEVLLYIFVHINESITVYCEPCQFGFVFLNFSCPADVAAE